VKIALDVDWPHRTYGVDRDRELRAFTDALIDARNRLIQARPLR
jgi:hypothetical protein